MVVVPMKNSDPPRITVGLTGLNKFVKRPVHPTRVPREAVAAIPPGMKVFTLDSRHCGYWQIPFDESSSKLAIFLTLWGAYRFLRNAMGHNSVFPAHQSQTKDFRQIFCQIYLWPHQLKNSFCD